MFVYMGIISYCLYLIHQSIGYIIIHHMYNYLGSAVAVIAVAITVAIALSSLLTFFVEHPMREWIRGRYRARIASGVEVKASICKTNLL
jgi:peptidoglycan/LPS O-acetylase OafA/YrhL